MGTPGVEPVAPGRSGEPAALPAVTVVICSRDRPHQLAASLEAVVLALRAGDRLVVIDSASRTHDTVAVASRFGASAVRVERPGLSRARNAGLREADTPVVAFTDDDCRPEPDWLDGVRAQFRDPVIGFVTGRAVADRSGLTTSVLAAEQGARFTSARDVEAVGHGANMAFRRDALVELGGFDELLGSGARLGSGEDADMLYRCLEAGWHGAYEPAAVVTHSQWRSFGQTLRVRYRYGMGGAAFRVKVARRDPVRGRPLLRAALHRGFWYAVSSVRQFKWRHLMRALAYDAGLVAGIAQAALLPLDGCLFRDGRSTDLR